MRMAEGSDLGGKQRRLGSISADVEPQTGRLGEHQPHRTKFPSSTPPGADISFGDVNPSGNLQMSTPVTQEQGEGMKNEPTGGKKVSFIPEPMCKALHPLSIDAIGPWLS